MRIREDAMSFTDEAQIRMQDLAEFLTKDTRVNLALVTQLHDNEVLLTPGAFLMLVIPLIEASHATGGAGGAPGVSPEVVRASIGRLLETIRDEPAGADVALAGSDVKTIVVERKSRFRPRSSAIRLGPRANVRTSLSVIQAYWKRYCTIPPFCDTKTRAT